MTYFSYSFSLEGRDAPPPMDARPRSSRGQALRGHDGVSLEGREAPTPMDARPRSSRGQALRGRDGGMCPWLLP